MNEPVTDKKISQFRDGSLSLKLGSPRICGIVVNTVDLGRK